MFVKLIILCVKPKKKAQNPQNDDKSSNLAAVGLNTLFRYRVVVKVLDFKCISWWKVK